MFRRMLALCAAGLLLLGVTAVVAETAGEETLPDIGDEQIIEDDVPDDGMGEIVGVSDRVSPSVEGLTPLYTTKIKFLTSSGYSATIRADQDQNSTALGYAVKGAVVTIYRVLPAYVLIEHNGGVGLYPAHLH